LDEGDIVGFKVGSRLGFNTHDIYKVVENR